MSRFGKANRDADGDVVDARGNKLATKNGTVSAPITPDKIAHNTAGAKVIASNGTVGVPYGEINYSSSAASNSIVIRDNSGKSKITEPIDGLDIANKAYVDSAIAAAIAAL